MKMDTDRSDAWQSMSELLDRSGIHIWQTDQDHILRFASTGFQALFTTPNTTLVGQPFSDIGWKIAGEGTWSDILTTGTRGKTTGNATVAIPGLEGTSRKFALKFEHLFDEEGRVSGHRGTCQAITSNQNDKATSPDSVSELAVWKDYAHAASDWFWAVDSDLKVSYISENQEQVTGIPNSGFMGMKRSDFEGADFDEARLREHEADMAARRPFKDFTYPNVTPEGNARWIRVSGVPQFDKAGNFSGYRGVGRDFTDQQEAILKGRQTEQTLLDALELMPIGISLWDKDEKFVISNSVMRKSLPTFAHLLEKPGIQFEDYARAVAESGFVLKAVGNEEEWIANALTNLREASGTLYEDARADGTWVRIAAFRTSNGGALLTFVDITELKERESEAQAAQSLLTDALEAIGLGFAVYDNDERLVMVNTAFRDMFPGMEHVLVPGASFAEVTRAGGIANKMPNVEAFVETRVEMRKKGIKDKVVEIRPGVWKVVSDFDSRDGHKVSVWTDVSQIKKQEQALRETEGRFSIAFHFSPLLMAIARLSDGGYVEVNEKFVEMTGYSRAELLANDGIGVSVFAEEDTKDGIRSRLKRGQEIDDVEVVMHRKDGEPFEVLISSDIIEVAGEQRILIIGMDFSSHKRLENSLIAAKNEAEFANRTKSEFLANMSHELRTPLNAVIGFSEFLANETYGPLGDPRYVEYIGDIRDSGTHLLNLINEILDVAKVEAGKMELRENEVDLDEMVVRCIRSVEGRARKSGLSITGIVAPDLPFLRCDETKFRQILINVLNNAVKFTDRDGTIEVEGDLNDDGDLEIRIKDNGIGIAESDMEAVFKVFGQAESSLDRRFEGAGLGLPLTKALVELHAGDFRLESELGVGTTVFIVFPKDRLVERG
jgi:PAS domain S-box-containing protein